MTAMPRRVCAISAGARLDYIPPRKLHQYGGRHGGRDGKEAGQR